jgi:hypothetical protein
MSGSWFVFLHFLSHFKRNGTILPKSSMAKLIALRLFALLCDTNVHFILAQPEEDIYIYSTN